MIELTAKDTKFTKQSYPFLMGALSLLALSIGLGLPQYYKGQAALFENVGLLSFLFPALMVGIAYHIHTYVKEYMDSVYDTGHSLLLRRDNKEIEVPLSEVADIKYNTTHKIQNVVLTLKKQTPFGNTITFMSVRKSYTLWQAFSKHKAITDLIQRVRSQAR